MKGKADEEGDDEQAICDNRRVHVLRRQSKGDERLGIIGELGGIAKMVPGPVEKNVGQPTLVRFRKLIPAPVDRSVIAQKSIDQGEDRIEIFVVRAPAV